MKHMKILFTLLLMLIASSQLAVKASSTLPMQGSFVKATDPNISYMGRTCVKYTDIVSFNYPGTTILARFTGTSLKMVCRPKTGYFMASVDGCEPFKVAFTGEKDSVVTIACALQGGEHDARIMYVSEGVFHRPEFRGFLLDKGCRLSKPAPLPSRKIEFIGNSITCGYGIESVWQKDRYEEATANHALTYANIVSDSLNAQHTCIARSGIGVYRNYNGPRNGDKKTMPWHYTQTLFDHPEYGTWDCSLYQPQLICINLGTNDLSTKNYSINLYESAYRKFVSTLRGYYPDAKIVLLTGPMLGEKENELQKDVLNRIAREFNDNGDRQVYRFDFSRQTGELGYGASWHPSFRQHQRMAEELLPFLRELMDWR